MTSSPKRLRRLPPRGRAGRFGAAVRGGPWTGLLRGPLRVARGWRATPVKD